MMKSRNKRSTGDENDKNFTISLEAETLIKALTAIKENLSRIISKVSKKENP